VQGVPAGSYSLSKINGQDSANPSKIFLGLLCHKRGDWHVWYNLTRDKCWVTCISVGSECPEPAERIQTFPPGQKNRKNFSFGELSDFFGAKEATLEILGAEGYYWMNPSEDLQTFRKRVIGREWVVMDQSNTRTSIE
jgi:hypothetical protein